MQRVRSGFDGKFALVSIAIVAVIVHGSLYPYAFRIPGDSGGALATLLASWSTPPTSYGDLVANILLYMPLGFFGVQALRAKGRLLAVTLFGLLLCVSVEIAQYYDEGRITNMSDVYLNTFGTWLGGLAGRSVREEWRRNFAGTFPGQPVACLLLVALLGYRLYPYVPVIDLHKYWQALKPVVVQPSLPLLPTFHYFAIWLTACYLAAAIAGQRFAGTAIFLLVVFTYGARITIAGLAVTAPEIAGTLFALAVWFSVLTRSRASALIVAFVLCVAIVAFRLAPFDFQAMSKSFGWMPFRGFLGGSLGVNIVSFLEKFFLYGSLIWIGCQAGLRISVATAATAGLLLATSLAETHLPGRSAEITDTVMALLIGGIFATMIAPRVDLVQQRRASTSGV